MGHYHIQWKFTPSIKLKCVGGSFLHFHIIFWKYYINSLNNKVWDRNLKIIGVGINWAAFSPTYKDVAYKGFPKQGQPTTTQRRPLFCLPTFPERPQAQPKAGCHLHIWMPEIPIHPSYMLPRSSGSYIQKSPPSQHIIRRVGRLVLCNMIVLGRSTHQKTEQKA